MKHCVHFPRCGGCTQLDRPYDLQVEAKQQYLSTLFAPLGCTVPPVRGSSPFYYYRHKIQLPFGYEGTGRKGKPLLGCYAQDSHLVVNQQMCHLQDKDCTEIVMAVRNWAEKTGLSIYNERSKKGFLRHVLIRRAAGTGEILIGLVTNGRRTEGTRHLSRLLLDMIAKRRLQTGTVVGIVQNVNNRATNVVLGNEEYTWWGRGYIKECLGTLTFKIGMSTFFQVNPFQTPVLYDEVLKHIPRGEKVLDCYCGVGSITLWVARNCSEVTGIEENVQSVRAAQIAAKRNSIQNVSFINGDVLEVIAHMSLDAYSCAIVDPPRKGIDPRLVHLFLNSTLRRIIYVSCNPLSLKRDLDLLKDAYVVSTVQGVDMFPHTDHIESVAVLERR